MIEARVDWWGLVLETLRTPNTAAERIMSWKLPRPVLYQALIAVSALNALVAGIGALMRPVDGPLPPLLSSPLSFFVLVAGGVVVAVHILYWVGRAMGGTGDLGDLLALFTWLQVLRFLGQVAVLVSSIVFPALALLLALAIFLVGVWLVLHFVNSAMRLNSLMHAAGLLIATLAGLMLGLMLLITLIGAANLGLAPSV